MSQEKLGQIIFYQLEAAIKSYRQFAQRNISQAGYDITIDQWLVLKKLQEEPGVTQQQLAIEVFKDFASVTRIIELLVNKEYIERKPFPGDRRRSELLLTDSGREILKLVQPVILRNRRQALAGLDDKKISQLNGYLQSLIENCKQ